MANRESHNDTKLITKILSVITMGLLLLVMLQGAAHLIPVKGLKGAYVGEEKPHLTWQGFTSGEWQQQCDRYAKEHHGFREGAIRLHNQYVWSLYHRSPNEGAVMVGKDDYLFEPYFVDEYYEGCMYQFTADSVEMAAIFDRTAQRLAKLQEILDEQGVRLFVACLPGKEQIYPEKMPERGGRTRTKYMTAVGRYPVLFDRYGVHYVNISRHFDQLKGRVPYLLFTKTGTHWSNIASTYAFDSVMRYMQTFGPAIAPVALGEPYYDKRREPDADLDELLNKLFYIPAEKNQYVDVRLPQPQPEAERPSMVVIGDSFFWNVLYNFPINELFSHFRYWYYFNSIYCDPENENKTVADIDLVEQLLSADYVMLSYCTVQLYKLGNGFINKALVELCYDADEIAAVRASLEADTTSGLTVEERLDRDLESYFPALAEEHPTRRCTRLRKQ